MRLYIIAFLFSTVYVYGGMVDLENSDFFESPRALSWERATEFCLSLNARMLNVEELEVAYESNLGEDFLNEYYWSGTPGDDYYGAYVFQFGFGLKTIHHVSQKHRVMCIKKRKIRRRYQRY